MKKVWLVLIISLTVVCVCSPLSYALDTEQGPFAKLGRGLTNIITGGMEVGKELDIQVFRHGLYKGLVFGAMKGTVKAVSRIGAGVYDVVTFPIDYPEDYKSVITPEYLYIKP